MSFSKYVALNLCITSDSDMASGLVDGYIQIPNSHIDMLSMLYKSRGFLVMVLCILKEKKMIKELIIIIFFKNIHIYI